MRVVVERNTPIPANGLKVTIETVTVCDNQSGMECTIYGGERLLTKDNRLLGDYEIDGIPTGPGGSQPCTTTFNILQVSYD